MVLASCGGGGSDAPQTPKVKTTMLVYMVASNLVPAGNGPNWTLSSMLAAKASDDVNIVLQIGGGTGAGQIPGVDMTRTQRYQLVAQKPASGSSAGAGWKLELLPDAKLPSTTPMNEGNTLRDFIQWGTKAFPAQQYHLVMYDHGGGPVGGYGNDEANSDGRGMRVSTLAQALKEGGTHFEMIGFDTCLMANLEVASVLAPYGNYLTATEDLTLFWDWQAITNLLATKPLASGAELGREIVLSYKATQVKYALQTEFVTTSVTDLRQVPALVDAVGAMTKTLQQAIDSNGLPQWLKVAAATRQARSFQSTIFGGSLDLVDLLSWSEHLQQQGAITAAQYGAVQAALHRAVVVMDDDKDSQTNGLSLMVPRYQLDPEAYVGIYLAQGFPASITDFTRAYVKFANSSAIPRVEIGAPQIQNGQLLAQISASTSGADQLFDGAYAVLESTGIFGALQEIDVVGSQLHMKQPNLWPSLNRKMVSVLRMRESSEPVFAIPVLTRNSLIDLDPALDGDPEEWEYRNGMLLAKYNATGQLQVYGSIEQQQIVGNGVAQVLLKPGQKFYPLRMNLQTHELEHDPEPLVAPQGDWLVEWKTPSDAGYTIYLAASDWIGRLTLSPITSGIALPVAGGGAQ